MMRLQIDPRLRAAVIPNLVLESQLDTNERMCIAVLAMHGEVSFPGRDRIASLMGCSLATVKRTLSQLETKGWVVIERRRGENGRQTSNRYTLRVPEATHPISATTAVQDEPRTGVQPEPPPGSNRATNNTLKNGKEEQEVLPAGSPPATPAVPADEEKKLRAARVLALLDTFTLECHRLTGHSPEREHGRDRKLMGDTLRICGEIYEHAEGTLKDWIEWRAREKKIITIPAWRAAAEPAYQKWRERKKIAGPVGGRKVHPDVERLRKWRQDSQKQGTATPTRGA